MRSRGPKRLGDFFRSRKETGREDLPTVSVTLTEGLVRRELRERRTETSLLAGQHLFVKSGDIAYNMMRMWQGASGLAMEDCNVSPAYVVLTPKETIDGAFASYLFKTPRMLNLLWAYSYGLTDDRLRLYFREFCRIPVELPDLKTQRNLTSVLCPIDNLLTASRLLLANKKVRRQVVIDDLLEGRRRLPRFADQQWSEVRLRDVAQVNPSTRCQNSTELQTSFVSMSDLLDNGGLRQIQTLPTRELGSGYTRFRSGDVLVAKITPCFENNKRAFVPTLPTSTGLGSTELTVVRPTGLEGLYVYYVTLMSRFHRFGIAQMVGSAGQRRVPGSSIRQYQFYVPHQEERGEILQILSSIDDELTALNSYVSYLSQLKAAILNDSRFFGDELRPSC